MLYVSGSQSGLPPIRGERRLITLIAGVLSFDAFFRWAIKERARIRLSTRFNLSRR